MTNEQVIHMITFSMLSSVFTILTLELIFRFSWKTYQNAYDHIKLWTQNPEIKPLTGFYGKFVMSQVKKILIRQYSQFPQVGDLLRAKATDKMFIVTYRHQPEPISPHGYIDLQRMDEGHNELVRISLRDYYPDSYEKIPPCPEPK